MQAEKLGVLAQGGALGSVPIIVDYAMRYGAPALSAGIEALCAKGCERVLVLPLYPQYAASTTATAFDEIARVLGKMRRQPTLRFAPPYFDDAAYIEALAQGMREGLAALDFQPEVIVASFHGLPQFQIDKGDPYRTHCETTWRLLREAMGLDERQLRLSFQSRFGRAKWLEPYTADTVAELAKSGVKRLALIAPGFSPTVWRPWRNWASTSAICFWRPAARNSRAFPVSTMERRGCGCLRRWRAANWRDGRKGNSPPIFS